MSIRDDLERTALLIIDVQNDFCPGGSLAVPEGDEVIPVINSISSAFPFVVATRDWHPAGHISFASTHSGKEPMETTTVDGIEQILWPEHCVQGSEGAAFRQGLDTRPVNLVLHKGTKQGLDSYSAFFENDKSTATGLHYMLQGHGFDTVAVCGLAADVCVYFTAMDARKLGLNTYLIEDGTRGVDVPEGSIDRTRNDMRDAGVSFIKSSEISS
jgi:nicotinamidase/pyrazinamidase